MDLDGSNAFVLATGEGPLGIAVDATWVYFTDFAPVASSGAVLRVSR